jgi:thiamine transport system ATP-binding protein
VSGLTVRDLVVRFGATTAVDAADVDVSPGAVLALLGPSGCGKSTLLRAVAGLEQPSAGTVAWDGADLATVPVHRRGFGLMFQDGQLFPHRDVTGNVEFGLRMNGLDRPTRRRRVGELLELVGLAGYERRAVPTLSGGEQQRVALARALAPRPRLLLLDEPLSALDRTLRERLSADLSSILAETRTTALYVTHDHDEAFTVADQVAVMAAGSLLQTASPARLWRHPADERIARFLGYRWFVPLAALRRATTDLDFPGDREDPAATASRPSGPLTVALRPESLVVDADGSLVGQVVEQRFTRGGTTLLVAVPGVGEVGAWTPGVERLSPGSGVRLRLEPEAIAVLRPVPSPTSPRSGVGRGTIRG